MPWLQLHLHSSVLCNRHTRTEYVSRTLLWTSSSLQWDRFSSTFSVQKDGASLPALVTKIQTRIHSCLEYSHTQWWVGALSEWECPHLSQWDDLLIGSYYPSPDYKQSPENTTGLKIQDYRQLMICKLYRSQLHFHSSFSLLSSSEYTKGSVKM